MPDLTLDAIVKAVDKLLEGQLAPIKTDVAAIRETVNSHTTTLDGIAKESKTADTELPVINKRLERMEKWITAAAPKLGLEYKP